MNIFNCIKTRRSIRNYTDQPIDSKMIKKLIKAAIWAPSAKNGQPWKFCIIQSKDLIEKISELSIYRRWMKTSACFIIVFLDKEKSYDYIKDIQAIGASIQNILLTAHSYGIGSCWIGEILKQEKLLKKSLEINNENLELMAVVSLGYSNKDIIVPKRKPFESNILFWK